MSRYLLSKEAEEDVFEIWRYLADRASVETANRIESKLYQAFELLTRSPNLGHKRSDLTKHPVLFFSSSALSLFDRLPHKGPAGNRGCAPWKTGYRATSSRPNFLRLEIKLLTKPSSCSSRLYI
jgi:plasmid stabilization system protein ParE